MNFLALAFATLIPYTHYVLTGDEYSFFVMLVLMFVFLVLA